MINSVEVKVMIRNSWRVISIVIYNFFRVRVSFNR